jgi:hypothetical protein
MQPLETPDVTPIQKLSAAGLALLGAILTLVNAFEWAEIDAGEAAAISGAYVAFAAFALTADAVIRHGRSRAFSLPPKGLVAEDESDSSERRLGA